MGPARLFTRVKTTNITVNEALPHIFQTFVAPCWRLQTIFLEFHVVSAGLCVNDIVENTYLTCQKLDRPRVNSHTHSHTTTPYMDKQHRKREQMYSFEFPPVQIVPPRRKFVFWRVVLIFQLTKFNQNRRSSIASGRLSHPTEQLVICYKKPSHRNWTETTASRTNGIHRLHLFDNPLKCKQMVCFWSLEPLLCIWTRVSRIYYTVGLPDCPEGGTDYTIL